MPTYIADCRIDWGWAARTDAERQIIKVHHPRLDDRDHTIETFAEALARASSELPGVAIAALVDDTEAYQELHLARDGKVTRVPVKSGRKRHSITLGQDDKVRALLAADPGALFPVEVTALDRLAAGDTKLSRGLYVPEPTLRYLQAEAARLDSSLSSVVQRAWTQARERIAALPDREAASALRETFPSAETQMQTLYFPTTMLVEMEAEAKRFDSSLSWLVQLAIAIAR